ncbi:MAG: hypothetical protein MJ187_00320 [Alphaproteobacteria bacterium]|nr:hypothetical protein [Alphaproteobacteria bacterium]
MAITAQNFIKLANFYNQMTMVMSAICVEKGGISMENYVGRFFAADVLEYTAEYGRRLMQNKQEQIGSDIASVIERFVQNYERIKSLTTPTQRPIHEMTLEEFERLMNI